jgi:quinol monooxygenase YgiN
VIVVAATVRVRAERRAEAIRAAHAMASATRREPGCRRYEFFVALDDPERLFLFEEWESPEALARHFETPHMHAFQRELPALLAGPLDVHRYEVAAHGPMT